LGDDLRVAPRFLRRHSTPICLADNPRFRRAAKKRLKAVSGLVAAFATMSDLTQQGMLVVKYISIATRGYSTPDVSLAAQAEPACAFVCHHPSLDWVKAESLVDLFWHDVHTHPHAFHSLFLSFWLWM